MEEEKKIPRLIDLLGTPIINVLTEHDITPSRLAKKLNEELDYEEESIVGAGDDRKVLKAKTVSAMNLRQKARMDAHRLLGNYPAEIKGDAYINIFQQNNMVISPVVRELLSRHSRDMKFEEALEVEFKEVNDASEK